MHLWSIVLRTVALPVFVAILATASARAACVVEGGTEFCGSPLPTPWTYGACDEAGSFLFRAAAWCTASGGTNTSSGCSGATPHTEENIVARSVQFSELVHGSTCSIASDTGWGASFTSFQCWSGADAYSSGILLNTFRRLSTTCANGGGELISPRKDRVTECPLGYTVSRLQNGTVVCKRPIEDCDGCSGVGNPVTPGTGVKVQREVDYRHPLGLQLSRHYHSFQFYEPLSLTPGGVHTETRFGAVWRTGFDKRIIVINPVSTFVNTAISLPSGEVQYFDAAGKETFNYRGASGTLVTVAGTGYFYNGPDSTEFYGTDGRLRSISLASGQVFTLAYSDGTTGPNGGFILDANGNPTLLVLPVNSLIRVADLLGNTLSFGYDIQRRIVIMTDPSGGQYRYSYDAISNLVSVEYPDTRIRTYRYNEPANMVGGASIRYALTSIVDENDNLFASFKYDTSGRAVSTEHAGGAQRYQLTYNASDTSITDPLATPRTVGFATIGGVSRHTSVSQPGGLGYGAGVKRRSHDSNGNVTSQTDFNNVVTCYAYDSVRNLETVRVEGLPAGMSCPAVLGAGAALPAGSRKIVAEWHARWRLPLRVSEPLRRTSFAYNGDGAASCAPASALIAEGGPAGQPIAVLCGKTMGATADADGAQGFGAAAAGPARVWTYSHNALGQVLSADGPRTDVADVTSYVYNAQGNLASVTNAAGHVTSITAHNAHGQPLTVVDPNGLTTTLAYDARQRLISRNVGGELTSYDYDGVGQLIKVTLPDGSFLSYTYDAAHRLTQVSDNLGNRIAYTLDAMGNRTQEQVFDPLNALAQIRSRVFSNLNRLAQEIGAQSQVTAFGYDNQGNVTSIDGPLAGTVDVTANAYDALNRLIRVTDPNAGQVNYGHNALDQLTSVSDPRTLATSYSYDGLNNLNQLVSPDTGATVNAYDAAGNLLTQTDAKGQVTTYAYDTLNRVTSITYQGATHTYQYDQGVNGMGRLTQISEPNSTTQYVYDQQGRLTSETRLINAVSYGTAYSYDSFGRLTGMSYPSGRQVSYTLDSLGRIQQINTTKDTTTQLVVTSVAYRPFGPSQSLTFGNGQTYSRGFDQDGRVASYTLAAQSFAVGYDAASRIGFLSDVGNSANSNTYSYDSLDRLTNAVLPGTPFAYSYDAVGNRLSKTVGSSTDTYTPATTSNRLASIAPGTGPVRNYVHDANGAVTADGTNTYAYDTRGRLIQAVSVIGTTSYQVNSLGQRIRKTNTQGDTLYHYDSQGRLIAEGTPSGAVQKEYVYLGATPVAVLSGAAAAPLEAIIDNGTSGFTVTGTWPASTAVAGFESVNYQTHEANGAPPGAIVVDNTDAGFSVTGTWTASTAVAGYLGSNYQHHFANGEPPSAIVTDNATGTAVGTWPASTSVSGYIGTNYQVHTAGTGANTFNWTLAVPSAGSYQVYARWTQQPNRATNAKYTVNHAGGATVVTMNQEAGGGNWNLLGSFSFNAGNATISLSDNANDYVIADAVMLVPPGTAPNTATWTLTVPSAGSYQAYARWNQHPNRATDAKYTVNHAGGATQVTVNQEAGGGNWSPLGSFTFNAGQTTITLTDQANGFVIADAVMLAPPGAAPNTATWAMPAGEYQVYAKWPAHANRATNATYAITHAGGTSPIAVNQQLNGGTWNLLGTFTFGAGQNISLTDQANGYVIADAIRVVPTPNQPSGPAGVFYVHTDHLDTPRVISNSTSQVVWRWDHAEPFGSNPPNENPSGLGTFTCNLRLPGQYFDKETNLHYNYFRDYDPAIGRYIESDPIGLAGGVNTYAYVGGNPISFTDPTGLETYQCRRSLGGLPGDNQRSGPDIWGNPVYHQYSCTRDAKGKLVCGGQGFSESWWSSPGKPTTPATDYYSADACKQTQGDNRCFEQCLVDEWKKPRPRYGIPFGTDCQEYDDDVNSRCRKKCSLK